MPQQALSFDIVGVERLLQDIVDEALGQGMWITRARRRCGQELVENLRSIYLVVTAVLSRKDRERASGVVKGRCCEGAREAQTSAPPASAQVSLYIWLLSSTLYSLCPMHFPTLE